MPFVKSENRARALREDGSRPCQLRAQLSPFLIAAPVPGSRRSLSYSADDRVRPKPGHSRARRPRPLTVIPRHERGIDFHVFQGKFLRLYEAIDGGYDRITVTQRQAWIHATNPVHY